jgi:hypothetical protein
MSPSKVSHNLLLIGDGQYLTDADAKHYNREGECLLSIVLPVVDFIDFEHDLLYELKQLDKLYFLTNKELEKLAKEIAKDESCRSTIEQYLLDFPDEADECYCFFSLSWDQ